MKISLIVAMAANRVIGLDNQMPWYLSADLKHFKQITMGHPIIMGRRTFEAIGRPLPGRTNIIVSRNAGYRVNDGYVVNDIESAISTGCRIGNEVFIIGGATLYEMTLPLAENLYITQINREFNGDTFFPEFDRSQFEEASNEAVVDDANAGFTYNFIKLTRK